MLRSAQRLLLLPLIMLLWGRCAWANASPAVVGPFSQSIVTPVKNSHVGVLNESLTVRLLEQPGEEDYRSIRAYVEADYMLNNQSTAVENLDLVFPFASLMGPKDTRIRFAGKELTYRLVENPFRLDVTAEDSISVHTPSKALLFRISIPPNEVQTLSVSFWDYPGGERTPVAFKHHYYYYVRPAQNWSYFQHLALTVEAPKGYQIELLSPSTPVAARTESSSGDTLITISADALPNEDLHILLYQRPFPLSTRTVLAGTIIVLLIVGFCLLVCKGRSVT